MNEEIKKKDIDNILYKELSPDRYCYIHNYIINLQEENQKLVKVIDELKKHICSKWYCFDNESVEFEVAKDILNKLTKLKEK